MPPQAARPLPQRMHECSSLRTKRERSAPSPCPSPSPYPCPSPLSLALFLRPGPHTLSHLHVCHTNTYAHAHARTVRRTDAHQRCDTHRYGRRRRKQQRRRGKKLYTHKSSTRCFLCSPPFSSSLQNAATPSFPIPGGHAKVVRVRWTNRRRGWRKQLQQPEALAMRKM